MKIVPSFICLLVTLFLGVGHSLGQAKVPRTRPTPNRQAPRQQPDEPPLPVLPDIRNDPDVEAADVAIIANITMKELRFDQVPNPTVEFPGKPKVSTIWKTERYNLPDQVQPGVTYRNVGIRLKITSRLADIDRIVAEALGEIPIQEPAMPATDAKPETDNVKTAQPTATGSGGAAPASERAPLKKSPK